MPEPSRAAALNPRVEAIRPSATMAMSARALEMTRRGLPVISLCAGEPDFDTPAPIAEAGIAAIRSGFTRYTESDGLYALREAIAAKLLGENGCRYSPRQIVCSNGAKQSVALCIEALCRPGDEALIPAPYWVSYPEMTRLSGATPVALPTRAADGYKLRPEALEAALTPRTRLLILCTPSNPTGAVYTRAELEALAGVLARRPEVYVLSDEIYEYILFEGAHVSFAALEGMYERTLTVNGFSKAYAMTGWRLGYLAAPEPLARAASKIQSHTTSGPGSISQQAGLAALAMGPEPVRRMVRSFRERRDYLLGRLAQMPGLDCPRPAGAFYLFPQVGGLVGRRTPGGAALSDGDDVCRWLLEQAHVALVPGSAFGDRLGVRISYAAALPTLAEAMDRIEAALATLG